MLSQLKDKIPEGLLRNAADERVDRNNTTHVGICRSRVIVDDFEIRLVDDDAFSADFRFPVNDELVAHRENFMNVGKVEPAEDDPVSEDIGSARRFDRGFEKTTPAGPPEPALAVDDLDVQAHRRFHGAVRKDVETGSVFVASRVVGERVPHSDEAELFESFR